MAVFSPVTFILDCVILALCLVAAFFTFLRVALCCSICLSMSLALAWLILIEHTCFIFAL